MTRLAFHRRLDRRSWSSGPGHSHLPRLEPHTIGRGEDDESARLRLLDPRYRTADGAGISRLLPGGHERHQLAWHRLPQQQLGGYHHPDAPGPAGRVSPSQRDADREGQVTQEAGPLCARRVPARHHPGGAPSTCRIRSGRWKKAN